VNIRLTVLQNVFSGENNVHFYCFYLLFSDAVTPGMGI
jgi:hypothetical protein